MNKQKLLTMTLLGLVSALILVWASLSYMWRTSQTIDVPIAAYQARNWLYGEHLLFRVQFDSTESCQADTRYACADVNCHLKLSGECRQGKFITQVSRFFLADQKQLSTAFPHYYQKGRMTMRVSKHGPMFVEHFTFPH